MLDSGGGWGIPIAPPTLMVTVGGIASKPRLIDGELQNRELLSATLSFDHDIVDGAPAARFSKRLTQLVEGADGLSDPPVGRPGSHDPEPP
jgi:pyruvate/2-oxoglutarate dehydrogenase complex dihydrolipoamide acyltransferase (E2) component